MKKLSILFALSLLAFPAVAGASPNVYLNGVDITGAVNQNFQNVTVQIDAMGNIIMTAPQYHLINMDKNHQANAYGAPAAPQVPPAYGQNAPAYGQNTAPAYGQNIAPVYGNNPALRPSGNQVVQPTTTFSNAGDGLVSLPDPGKPTYLVAFFDSPGLLGYNIDVFINGTFVKTLMQNEAQVSFDITQYLVKGKNVLQYQMSMAADAGTSSKATVVLSLSKLTARQGNAIELTGQYARQYIRAADGPRLYQVEVFVP